MNIMTIHNLCYYLEEIGIIDQTSLSPFLSLYSFVTNKNKQNNNSNLPTKPSIQIFENILCAYLKKIFSVEKNYKIFSNKIINKFKQLFTIKQYNGLLLLFSLLSKKLNSFKIKSFYKIYNKKEEINFTNRNTYSNNTYSNIFYNKRIDLPMLKNKEKKNSINSLKIKSLKNQNKKEKNENKSDIINKSLDFIKINTNNIYNNTIPSTISRNNESINIFGSNKNIQLEFRKKQFLSKIKREHMVKFKRNNSNSVKNLKSYNSFKNFQSMLLNNFSPRFNNSKNNSKYNNKEINLQTENTKKFIDAYNNNNKKLNIPYESDEESLNVYITDFLKGVFSNKSENVNFTSKIGFSPTYNYKNSGTNTILDKKNNAGYIIKKMDKNSVKNDLSKTNMSKGNTLSLNDIQRIKQKLETLNYFNLSP